MSLKLKALGLGVLAMLAVSGFATMNAGASGTGHFVSDVDHTIIVGTEGPGTNHRLHLTGDLGGAPIGCNVANYHGTATSKTVTSLTIEPTYSGCSTTESSAVTVTPNGCTYTFTVTENTEPNTEQDVHLSCPSGKAIEIHHPSCTITVAGPQTVQDAVTYTKVVENGKHAITLDVNADFATQYHGGICIFLGTSGHSGSLDGTATVKGTNTAGEQVSITAT